MRIITNKVSNSAEPAEAAIAENIRLIENTVLRILQTGNDAHRLSAIRVLSTIAVRQGLSRSVLQALIGGLQDPDPDVREVTARALSIHSNAEVVEALLDSLRNDPDGDVKVAIAEVLASIDLPDQCKSVACDLLKELIRGRGENIVWEDIAVVGWDDWLDVQLAAFDAVVQHNIEDAVDDILFALDQPEAQDLSAPASRALIKLGMPGRLALFDLLANDSFSTNARLRRQATQALADTANPVAAEFKLFRLLARDYDPGVRRAAVPVIAVQSDNDHWLVVACSDIDASVRQKIVETCGLTLDGRLLRFLTDTDESVQLAALKVLETAGRLAATTLTEFPAYLSLLGGQLGKGSDQLQAARVRALGAIGLQNQAVRERLINCLDDSSVATLARTESIRAIARKPDQTTIDCLNKMLAASERQLRLAALQGVVDIALQDGADGLVARQIIKSAMCGGLGGGPHQPEVDQPAIATLAADNTANNNSQPKVVDSPLEAKSGESATTTLGSILDGPMIEDALEEPALDEGLTERDLQRLEMAASRKRHKHVSLDPDVSVQRDLQQMSVRFSAALPQLEIGGHLFDIMIDSCDIELQKIAAEALLQWLNGGGCVDVIDPDRLSVLLKTNDTGLLISVMRLMQRPDIAVIDTINRCLVSANPQLKAEALGALLASGQYIHIKKSVYETLVNDSCSNVRIAAFKLIRKIDSGEALLLAPAMILRDNGLDCKIVARELRGIDDSLLNEKLVDILGNQTHQRQWCIALDALIEINA